MGVATGPPTGVWSHRERFGVSPGAVLLVGPTGVSSQRDRFFLTTTSLLAVLASSHSPPRPLVISFIIASGRSGSTTSHRFRLGVSSGASSCLRSFPCASTPSSCCFSIALLTRCSSLSRAVARIASPYPIASPPVASSPSTAAANASTRTPVSRSNRRAWYSPWRAVIWRFLAVAAKGSSASSSANSLRRCFGAVTARGERLS